MFYTKVSQQIHLKRLISNYTFERFSIISASASLSTKITIVSLPMLSDLGRKRASGGSRFYKEPLLPLEPIFQLIPIEGSMLLEDFDLLYVPTKLARFKLGRPSRSSSSLSIWWTASAGAPSWGIMYFESSVLLAYRVEYGVMWEAPRFAPECLEIWASWRPWTISSGLTCKKE